MPDEEKKQFILPRILADAIDGLAEGYGGKGQLRRIGAAGLLMFLHATRADRDAYVLWGDALLTGSASLDSPPQISLVTSLGFRSEAELRMRLGRIPTGPWRGEIEEVAGDTTIVHMGDSVGEDGDCLVPILDPLAGSEPCGIEAAIAGGSFSEWFVVVATGDPLACAIRLEGRGMQFGRWMKHGDYVVVHPSRASEWRSGMLGVVVFHGKRRYEFRHVERSPRGGRLRLMYVDPHFGEEEVPARTVKAVYPVSFVVAS